MKIEVKTGIVILHVSDLMASHRLDPIRITLEDIEPSKGRITIECYGKAWASYWGAMGEQTIAQFFAGCDNCYLIGNLAPGLYADHATGEALHRDAKRAIRQRRKGLGEWRWNRLTDEQAEELMGKVHRLEACDGEAAMWQHGDLLTSIYGEDWMHIANARAPNPSYDYLARICDAVRDALRELAKPAGTPESKDQPTTRKNTMGQARNRGTRDQRVAEAVARNKAADAQEVMYEARRAAQRTAMANAIREASEARAKAGKP